MKYAQHIQWTDTSRALDEVSAHADRFDAVTIRQSFPGTAHADTRSIYLRWAEEWSIGAIFDIPTAVPYPDAELFPECMRLAWWACQVLGATDLGRVMIVSLKPGGVITEHEDQGEYARTFDRFHVVLQGGGASLTCNGDTISPCDGWLFWFNHELPHSARNDSDRERIHIIIDCVAPAWRDLRKAQLAAINADLASD